MQMYARKTTWLSQVQHGLRVIQLSQFQQLRQKSTLPPPIPQYRVSHNHDLCQIWVDGSYRECFGMPLESDCLNLQREKCAKRFPPLSCTENQHINSIDYVAISGANCEADKIYKEKDLNNDKRGTVNSDGNFHHFVNSTHDHSTDCRENEKPRKHQLLMSDGDFSDRYIVMNKPCVLVNLMDDWPAMKFGKWTPEMLMRRFSGKPFLYNNFFTDPQFNDDNLEKRDDGVEDMSDHLRFEDHESALNVIELSTFLEKSRAWAKNAGDEERSRLANMDRAGARFDINEMAPELNKFAANTPYIFDSSFSAGESHGLQADYTVPSMFRNGNDTLGLIAASASINYRWFLLGPKHSGSPLHVDPDHTSAWNALAVGRKWWVLISPDPKSDPASRSNNHLNTDNCYGDSQPPLNSDCSQETLNRIPIMDNGDDSLLSSQGCHDDKDYQGRVSSLETPNASKITRAENIPHWFYKTLPQIVQENERSLGTQKQIFSFIQQEGETVFVPSGWSHAVLNLEESVAVTHNFVCKNNTYLFLNWFRSNREVLNLSEEEHEECLAILETAHQIVEEHCE